MIKYNQKDFFIYFKIDNTYANHLKHSVQPPSILRFTRRVSLNELLLKDTTKNKSIIINEQNVIHLNPLFIDPFNPTQSEIDHFLMVFGVPYIKL